MLTMLVRFDTSNSTSWLRMEVQLAVLKNYNQEERLPCHFHPLTSLASETTSAKLGGFITLSEECTLTIRRPAQVYRVIRQYEQANHMRFANKVT